MKGSMEQYGSKVSSNSTPKLFIFTSASLFQLWHVRNKPTVQCFSTQYCTVGLQNNSGRVETSKGVHTSHTGEGFWFLFFLSFWWILFAWTRSFSSSGWLADGHLKEWCSLPGINSVWSFSSSYCCTTSAPWHRERGGWSLYWLRMRRHEHNESTDRSYTALLGVNLPVWSTGAWRVKNKIQRLSVRHRDQIHMPLQPTHSGWKGEEPGGGTGLKVDRRSKKTDRQRILKILRSWKWLQNVFNIFQATLME